MYITTPYALNYYEDKYLSVFLCTLHILLKISINTQPLLYICTNNHS